jgi:hypothetical protein
VREKYGDNRQRCSRATSFEDNMRHVYLSLIIFPTYINWKRKTFKGFACRIAVQLVENIIATKYTHAMIIITVPSTPLP